MKQVREKEGNGPDANNTDHCPYSRIEGIASKDSFVEEQHGQFGESECQRGTQLLCVINFQEDNIAMSPDAVALCVQFHMSCEVSVGSSNIDANCGDESEKLSQGQSLTSERGQNPQDRKS